MKTTLKHYQVLGTAFMRRREGSSTQPKGGILADEMGLGKTVMMLANIVNSTRSLKKTAKRRCTLIVASRALITQWEHEILKHTLTTREHKKHGIRVACHYAGNRFSGLDKVSEMEKFDVVLTTYSEVLSSYPSKKIPPELVTAKQKEIWWRETFEELKGDLHRVRWLRVVLDEAQAIKNHLSTTSKACRAISAVFHWAISGTPIQNTIKELYPYFLYIREPHTGSFKIFKENFVTPGDPTGMHRLQIYLNKFMVRRTHADTLFGARLLELPQPEQQTFWVEFNAVERQIVSQPALRRLFCRYGTANSLANSTISSSSASLSTSIPYQRRVVSKRNTITSGLCKFVQHLRPRTESQAHVNRILRLRQLCSHPFLIQGPISELLKREDFEKLGSITMDEDDNLEEGQNLLLQLRSMLARKIDAKNSESGVEGAVVSEGGAVPMDLVDGEGMEESTGGKHGEAYHFKRYLKNLASSGKWEVINERSTCSGCKQVRRERMIAPDHC